MQDTPLHILLADDDHDDCSLFVEALTELPLLTKVDMVYDGYQLMTYLYRNWQHLPQLLFLDLNMPCKNGFECLMEIKRDNYLKLMPVIIFSTSSDETMINTLYQAGAQHYICKPGNFQQLKELIQQAIHFSTQESFLPRTRENFVLVPY